MAHNTSLIHRVEVEIKGKVFENIVNLTLSQPFDNHHSLIIYLDLSYVLRLLGKDPNSGTLSLHELTEKWSGEEIVMYIMAGSQNSAGKFQETSRKTFKGCVTRIQIQKHDAVKNYILIEAYSPSIVFSGTPFTRSFLEKKVEDIIKVVGESYAATLNFKPVSSETVPYLVQYQEDNFNFLQRIAEAYGEWFFYDGEKLIFGKSGRAGNKVTELEYGSNLLRMDFESQLVSFNSKGHFYDYFTDQKVETASKEVTLSGLSQDATAALTKSKKVFAEEGLDTTYYAESTDSMMRQAMLNRKREASNGLVILKGTSTEIGLKIGHPIKVIDDILENGRLVRTDQYGTFLITNIQHFIDSKGAYQNSFSAVPQDTDYPPVDYRVSYPKAESQPAKVKDTNDPESMGRVKVQFYWQKDKETTPWIRVASLMGGDKSGVYFTPEKDEVVFVDFEFGNPNLPFVRGSMYHGNVKPGDKLFEAQNNYKGIITRGGNHIIIDDTNGKEEIRIYNKENKNEVVLSVNGDPHISIKSKGKITLEAEEIVMKAKTISMKADKNWSAEGSEVKIEGNEVSVEGKSQTSVKGNQLSLEGKAQASLKASMVNIN
jgi:type VI secretion system secreted protein VgrG